MNQKLQSLIDACQPFADLLENPEEHAPSRPLTLEIYPSDVISLRKALDSVSPDIGIHKDLQNMLDCKVSVYVGAHVIQGKVDETDNPDVLVLKTKSGTMKIRIEQISAFTVLAD